MLSPISSMAMYCVERLATATLASALTTMLNMVPVGVALEVVVVVDTTTEEVVVLPDPNLPLYM